ncbi:relaxase/mobilization nuclease domain-containing protein [Maribacter polysaccharolyticus]|uniref:relaxase/mobilization nuclease domain-containing protein n=1 Tax=Maribacter polysaccharolyticus TaxID=3020831 RepID=UPI00237F0E7B|nr:relaxase/mobilization nuclease domain-containing protein [Maribacter polysaccharolyticus]MDE3744049.1 relaxase/mobilization nuclease domain-containing protein [Maribacter polysaccharolyticus]
MIIKILGSQSSFRGVSYNEDKINEGKSEGLVAENFIFPEGMKPSKADYINYLKYHSSTNDRVKAKQFHAVISAKGQEHSPQELVGYAKKYLNEMGYGKNPYLIYFHNDTDNNHVHMVSTRIGPDGKKIDDSFEKLKSQEILRGFGVEYGKNIPSDIDWAKGYGISTHGQFITLLESKGINSSIKDDQLNIYFKGTTHTKLALVDIPLIKESKSLEGKRIKTKEKIKKYSRSMELPELKQYLHGKMGMELVTHTAKGKDAPYGYTLIDHREKTVFKGSELLPIKALLMGKEIEQVKEAIPRLLREMDFKGKDWNTIQGDMATIGARADRKGNVYLKVSNEIVARLNRETVSSLWKNHNTNTLKNTAAMSVKSASAIAHILNVHEGAARIDPQIDSLHYSNLVAIAIHHSKGGTKQFLEERDITVHPVASDQLLYDRKNNIAVLLGEDLRTLNRFKDEHMEQERIQTPFMANQRPDDHSTYHNQGKQTSLFEQLMFSSGAAGEDDEENSASNKKGKKKKRNLNQSI